LVAAESSFSIKWNKTDSMHPVPGMQDINISWRYSCIKDKDNCCSDGIPFEVDIKAEYNGYGK